jgi:CubicO group peptidase (beta-lactamase class C family)
MKLLKRTNNSTAKFPTFQKKVMRLLIIIKLFTFLFVSGLLKAQPSFITDSLDAYINHGIKDWNIPGLSIAIVKDGKTVFLKGYGVKDLITKEKVDENTLFFIASNSKLFTGMAAAKLENEKKLSLDDRVTKHIPWFKLYDSTSTALVTLRDLLCHRIGTKTFQGDFTFWGSTLPKDSIVYKMRLLKPNGIFRQSYGYCNSAFLTAGQIIEKVSGMSWQQYITENMLKPVGMNRTFMNTEGITQQTNLATPYSNSFGKLEKLPYDEIDNIGPAGSMVSCVSDLVKWLNFQLDSGKVNGQSIIPWAVLQKTRTGNTLISTRKSPYYPSTHVAYGLGELMTDYNGRQVYWHTGGAYGFVTNVCFVPDEKLGITILTNNDNQNFFEALRYQILDAYLDVKYTDRSKFQLQFQQQATAANEKEWNKWNERLSKMNPVPLPLNAFTGDYFNDVYGNMKMVVENNVLKLVFEHHKTLTATLQYMDNNEFILTWSHPGYGKFAAPVVIKDGKVVSIEVKASDFIEYDAYVFVKKN